MLAGVFQAPLLFAAALVVAVLFGRRFGAGYADPPVGLAVLHRGEVAFVEAATEVLFPDGAGLPVVGRDAGLALYVDRHLGALPPTQRLQIRALFLLFEHLPLVLPARAPGGRDRFSSQPPASRIAVLERVARHSDLRIRLLFTALRAVLALGYLGHPANLHALGLAPFAIEPAVSDAELLFPRIGALPMAIGFVPADRTDATARPPLDPEGPRHGAYERAARARR